METKLGKTFDSGRRVVVDLKRKQAENYETDSAGVAHNKLRKLDGCKNTGSESFYNMSLVKYYSNFMKSGLPQRLMFFRNDEWIDFPWELVSMVRKDFQVKKITVEIELNDNHILLDFLHMKQLDLKTGFQQPVAWIDEAGRSFFPESTSDSVDDECYPDVYEDDEAFSDSSRPYGINLYLEIDIKRRNTIQLKEGSAESNEINMEFETVKENDRKVEVDTDSILPSNIKPLVVYLKSDDVRNIFLTGMGSSVKTDILEIQSGSSLSVRSRQEIFEKTVKMIKVCRGKENIRYAWLPSCKEAASNILMCGLRHGEMDINNSAYGVGIHLTALNCCATSSICCDVDENEERHIVLCRVVLGNTELVSPGSKQYCPSADHYDSGVDDIQNPSQYIIWQMNMSTHIYPEYVVRFKLSFNEEGHHAGNMCKYDGSGITSSQKTVSKLNLNASLFDAPSDCHENLGTEKSQRKVVGPSDIRVPKSPWIPFSMLLSCISDKIPVVRMKHVYINYNLFRRKQITREGFIRKLRHLVGDSLLRFTISRLQYKIPLSEQSVVPKVEKDEHEMESSWNTIYNEV